MSFQNPRAFVILSEKREIAPEIKQASNVPMASSSSCTICILNFKHKLDEKIEGEISMRKEGKSSKSITCNLGTSFQFANCMSPTNQGNIEVKTCTKCKRTACDGVDEVRGGRRTFDPYKLCEKANWKNEKLCYKQGKKESHHDCVGECPEITSPLINTKSEEKRKYFIHQPSIASHNSIHTTLQQITTTTLR